jgi:membrane protease YdiL (CAAX protease family)
LSSFSTDFVLPIFSSNDKIALIFTALSAGIAGAFLEELGWTGFAIPVFRTRRGVVSTGLIAGILWGSWHFLVNLWYGSAISGGVPLAAFISLYFLAGVAQLTAYRILMVWVYDKTESLLIAVLMHASLIVSTTPMLIPALTGAEFLTWFVGSAVLFWIFVFLLSVVGEQRLLKSNNRA